VLAETPTARFSRAASPATLAPHRDDPGGTDAVRMTDELAARRALAARSRWGLFTRADARGAGFSDRQISTRLRAGRWQPVVGAAIAEAGTVLDAWVRAQGVPLTWPDAVVALRCAARLHGLPVDAGRIVDVVVPTPRPPRHGLATHTYALAPDDYDRWGDALVTRRSRTIVDCFGRLPATEALDLAAWVDSRRLLSADTLGAWLDANPRAWGNTRRRELLVRLQTGRLSAGEDLLHDLLRRARIDGWLGGASLLEHIGVMAHADAYFPRVRLVVEVDGRRAHDEGRFQSDRTRQNALVTAGCTVLRFTWRDLTQHADQVVATLRATLARLGGAVS